MYIIIHIYVYVSLWYKRQWRSHFCLKNVTLGREGIVTGGSAANGLRVGGGPGRDHRRGVTTHHAPVVLQFAMTTQHSRAVDQWVLLAFFQVKKPFFIIMAFRFPSLDVDFCYDSLNDVYLRKQKKYGEWKQAIHTNKSPGLSLEGHNDTPGSNSEILLSKLLFWERGKI